MDMSKNNPQQPGLGPWLLARARDHGLTSNELADLLGLPCHRIRRITTVTDLDDLPMRAIRAVASALHLTWPGWLDPADAAGPRQPSPGEHQTSAGPATCHPGDADRVLAVLTLILGQPLHPGQIAHVLDWPAERAQHALAQRTPFTRGRRGLCLILSGGHAKLTVTPWAIDPAARARLHQISLQQQGPPPGIAYIAYRLGNHNYQDALDLARRHPELLATAVAAGYLTHQTGGDGHPASIQLNPDVAFSIGITTSLHDPTQAE
jgi:hypothetical protein